MLKRMCVGLITLFAGYAMGSKTQQYTVNMTAYNSLPSQTDSTPHITAANTKTRMGVIAVSSDIFRAVGGFGAKMRVVSVIRDPRRCNPKFIGELMSMIFVVEDTTNPRKTQTVDVWTRDLHTALGFGRCQVKVVFWR